MAVAVAVAAAAAAAAAVEGAAVAEPDRIGLSWRPALAAGILGNLDRIGVVEVMAESCVDAPAATLAAFRALAATTRVVMHATSLGLASTAPVDARALDTIARAVATVRPASWSEHLAFVRAGGVEIGHLATPPRTQATVEGACANLARLRRVVGMAPAVENIATLIDSPASTLDEPEFVRAVAAGADAPLLLDLHNLHANAVNFGGDAAALLLRLPLARVRMVHLAGGRRIKAGTGTRLLDDHLHAVPDPVYALLELLGRHAPQPLDVIIERDGRFPPFADLLAEVARARDALARGRAALREAA
jgi:uncharacterized protein (UPF0276 family)